MKGTLFSRLSITLFGILLLKFELFIYGASVAIELDMSNFDLY